jgi:hypothetical protein
MKFKGISKKFIVSIFAALFVLWLGLFFYLRNPALAKGTLITENIKVNAETLKNDVYFLSGIKPDRSFENVESVLKAENYVIARLKDLGYTPELQDVRAGESLFHNIIIRYESIKSKDVVVVGAHLDSCGALSDEGHRGGNPGADDNASGVAGILELARLFKEQKPELNATIEMVIYATEEPPYYDTPEMGSAVHAESFKERGFAPRFAVSLEMLGYFSEEAFSQGFPFPLLYAIYPNRGNYIAIVGRPAERELVREFKKQMNANSDVVAHSINAPAIVPGVDFSDHRSYWAHDWPAVMITDTAFLRNKAYHTPGDTPERLNYDKMAEVVRGVYGSLVNILTK